jgi:hypothetical protein
MFRLTMQKGRITITLQAVPVGEDLCVILSGGDRPHIGCVTLSLPRESRSGREKRSSTTSVLNILGHKDNEVAELVSQRLSAVLQINVVVASGIHIHNITDEEIRMVGKIAEQLADDLIVRYADLSEENSSVILSPREIHTKTTCFRMPDPGLQQIRRN